MADPITSAVTGTNLTTVVTLILALSVASERLVEIFKGCIPPLNKESKNETFEGLRKSVLQVLAVGSGILTTYLAKDYIPDGVMKPTETWHFIGLGLLASGGFGFWNSILTYASKLKDLKKAEIDAAKKP